MLELPEVTLVCIDTAHHELALAAIEQSITHCRFAELLFVTDRDIPIPELRTARIPPLPDPAAGARFVARELAGLVRTSHALLVRWDAFVVNPLAWTGEFLEFDYVAPASPRDDAAPAGPGIALLSRRLLTALQDPRITDTGDLDRAVDATHRALLEGEFGIRRAPPVLAGRFAFGTNYPAGQPFGFDGLFNMWMFFQPQDLRAFLSMASPAILGSTAALSLGVNLRDLGRLDEAQAVFRAIVGAHPGHALATPLLEGLRRATTPAAPAARPAVGRNDPCPCGSGQKFKQCHGRLGGGAPLPPLPASPAAAMAAANTRPAAPAIDFIPAGELAVLFHRARAAFDRDDFPGAEALYRKALLRQPDDPVANGFLGVIATRQRRFDEAGPLLRRAIERAPEAPEYHNNLGLYHQVRGDFEAAVTAYRRALALAPGYAPAWNNLGLSLQELGRLDEAIAAFRAACLHTPGFAEAHWNLALALLLVGAYDEGFAEQEWRFKVERQQGWWDRRRQFPAWTGEPLEGRRVLVLAEQGMGDIIQFVRYAEALARRGATVLVEAPADLADLLRGAPGVAGIVPQDGPYPPADFQVAVMSLPLHFGTRPDTIPAHPHYLVADPVRMARWRTLLGPRSRPRVGLAWAGNPGHERDRFRSMPLAALEPLLALPAIEWISLQKGAAAEQAAALPPGLALNALVAQSRNFADLAALIAELDLVITVDTSVVHLAGALGKPTLLLLDTAHDWRWGVEQADSPWYPTVRPIRQTARGDWASAVALARIDLSRHFGL